MNSQLFSSYQLRNLTLKNRIVIPPMCQYSAVNGVASDWHMIHFGSMLTSGVGLFIIEATAVEARGRITPECLGLWNDEQEESLGQVLRKVRKYSSMPIGIQLNHAGRKASTYNPFVGGGSLKAEDDAWTIVAPSPLSFAEGWQIPKEMTRKDMDQVILSFVNSAKRAHRIGIELIELHVAHGYLLSSFLSPIANMRNDEYGGSIENRMRFPLEVFDAVRAVWPSDKAMGVRCNGTDWHEGGITIDEAIRFSKTLEDRGCDFIDVSTGGNINSKIPFEPCYQVPYAEQIRQEVDIPVIAVGLITQSREAEDVIVNGQADLVAIGRAILHNPHLPWTMAAELSARVEAPQQYLRAMLNKNVLFPYALSRD